MERAGREGDGGAEPGEGGEVRVVDQEEGGGDARRGEGLSSPRRDAL